MASAIGNVALAIRDVVSAIGNVFEHLSDRSLRFLDQFARPVLCDAFWRVGCEVVVGVRGQEDVMGRPRAFGLRNLWNVLDAPSGHATVAESARKEKVCDQPISRCKAGVTETGKTAPGDREKPDPWPCGAECEAEIEYLAPAPSGTAVELQCWKSRGSARPFQSPRGNPDRQGNAGLKGSANCLTFPKRTWRRRQARARDQRLVKGPGTP